jgi:hypothetical protein
VGVLLARGRASGDLDAKLASGEIVVELLDESASVIADTGIGHQTSSHTLPGYYRGTKRWDGVVTYK